MTSPATTAGHAPVAPDVTLGATWPDLPAFRALAVDRRVIPVVRRFLADGETPIGVYRKLAADAPGTFLLESAEQGLWSRYSIVGARSHATLTARDGEACWLGDPPVGVPTDGDPLVALRDTVAALQTPRLPGLPPLTGGLVGYLSWDVVRRWERLPETTVDDLAVPELSMSLATDLAVLDHTDGTLLLVANAVNYDATDERVDEAWADAVARLDRMTAELAAPAPSTVAVHGGPPSAPTRRRTERGEYVSTVQEGKAAIRDGEVFQVVLSQRFEADVEAEPFTVYRALRHVNPSPYMFFIRMGGVSIVGSSPEMLVRVEGSRVETHPIAGTRPRGRNNEEDLRLAEELKRNEKERAEHVMLVDLGRNDVGRVCQFGSVRVPQFMGLERFSHVMHLTSIVEGRLADDRDRLDALVSCFPAGTVSGAPKVRAMQIIKEMEPSGRGLYAGAVGYLDFAGNLDFCIAIRTVIMSNGKAYVQTGAGLVIDSNPAAEYDETCDKAKAMLNALELAQHGL